MIVQYSLSYLRSKLTDQKRVKSENLCSLYHYTNNVKKHQIVKENNITLKLSCVNDFLDKNECIQVLEPFYYVCGELYNEKIIDDDFYKLLKGIQKEDLNKNISSMWVLCFSKDGNSEFMKNRYAPNDGWILEFNFAFFEDLCYNFPKNLGEINVYEMNYSFKNMSSVFKRELRKAFDIYKNLKQVDAVGTKRVIVDWLKTYSLCYKSADYRFEDEVRIVCEFKPCFSFWEDDENGVKIKKEINGNRNTVNVILDKKHLKAEMQQLDVFCCKEMNKTVITGEEIRAIYKKKSTQKIPKNSR